MFNEYEFLMDIIIVTNSLSFLGALLTICAYWRYSDRTAFSHKLTHRISWCALGYAFSKLIIPIQAHIQHDGWICITQTTLAIVFQLSSCFYCMAVAFVVYKVLVDVTFSPDTLEKNVDLIWIPAIAFAISPVITQDYGWIGYWCWFQPDSALIPGVDWVGRVEEVVCFFLPLTIALGYILLVSCKVQIRLNTLRRDSMDIDTTRHLGALKRLRLYPVVMLIVFTFPIADQLYMDINGKSWTLLTALHCLANGCLGMGMALIYFSNDRIRGKLLYSICGIQPDDPEFYDSPMGTGTMDPEQQKLLKKSIEKETPEPTKVDQSESALGQWARSAEAIVSPKHELE